MKIALLQANIGDFDDVKPIPEQSVPYDYFLYTENNLPFPLPHLNNRLKGKYVKINSHRFLNHHLFIWIDGRVSIKDGFIEEMIEKARGCDVVINLHPERGNPIEEIDWIGIQMKAGASYLRERYAREPFKEEKRFYKRRKMPDVPLYACNCFARWNNDRVNAAFNDWWMMCLEFSNFDQSQFSYVAWKHKLKINSFTPKISIGKHR